MFSKNLSEILSKYTKINKKAIKFKKRINLAYKLVEIPDPIIFKIYKIYIKTNLANSFIKPSKFLAQTFIFILQK